VWGDFSQYRCVNETEFISMAQEPNVGLIQPVVEVSRPHIIRHTQTHCRSPWNERSARRRDCYPHNTQQTQKTNIHVLSGIRTLDPSNRAVADLSFRPQGHREMRYDVKPKIRRKNKVSRPHAVSKERSSKHSSAII